MSLRYEQYRALEITEKLLIDLLTTDSYPKTKKAMRERVKTCLRHFPHLYSGGQPMWSKDDFTEDVK